MDTRADRRRSIPAGVIWGGFGVLAWSALTILTGGGAAQADDQDGNALDGLTSLVETTVSAVTTPVVDAVVAPVVEEVVAPVVQEAAAPAVDEVVAPVVTAAAQPVQAAAPAVVDVVAETVPDVPVVGPVAAPIVQAVADTADAVVAPVSDVLQDAPLAQITDPLLDAVTGLPVVGGLIDDTGVTGLLQDVVGVADDAVGVVGAVAGGTVVPVLDALGPQSSLPPATGSGAASGSTSPSAAIEGTSALAHLRPAVGAHAAANQDARLLSAGDRDLSVADASAGTSASGDAPAGSPAAPSSAGASGGTNTPATARLSGDGLSLLRGEKQASGASDDVLPTSPIADTDVSPD